MKYDSSNLKGNLSRKPIYKGCPNKECFCTGECKEIIGFESEKGFFDLPKQTECTHPEHKPPTHLHIPQGKGYTHVCPSCKKSTTIIPPQISF